MKAAMNKHLPILFFCLLFFLQKNSSIIAQNWIAECESEIPSFPGTMATDDTLAVCYQDTMLIDPPADLLLAEGEVFSYFLKNGDQPETDKTLFAFTDGQLYQVPVFGVDLNQVYYLTPVTGPDHNADGAPDANHPCTQIGIPRPLVFSSKPRIRVTGTCLSYDTDDCGPINEWSQFTLSLQPNLLNDNLLDAAPYTITSDFINGELNSEGELVFEAANNQTATFTITNAFGCSTDFEAILHKNCLPGYVIGNVPTEVQYICADEALSITPECVYKPRYDTYNEPEIYFISTEEEATNYNIIAQNNNVSSFDRSDITDYSNQLLYHHSTIANRRMLYNSFTQPSWQEETASLSANIITQAANATPVVFLDPLRVQRTITCLADGSGYALQIQVEGGLPAYDPSSTYTISGDISIELSAGGVVSNLYEIGDTYSFTITDDQGCSRTISDTVTDCESCLDLSSISLSQEQYCSQEPIQFEGLPDVDKTLPNGVSDLYFYYKAGTESFDPYDPTSGAIPLKKRADGYYISATGCGLGESLNFTIVGAFIGKDESANVYDGPPLDPACNSVSEPLTITIRPDLTFYYLQAYNCIHPQATEMELSDPYMYLPFCDGYTGDYSDLFEFEIGPLASSYTMDIKLSIKSSAETCEEQYHIYRPSYDCGSCYVDFEIDEYFPSGVGERFNMSYWYNNTSTAPGVLDIEVFEMPLNTNEDLTYVIIDNDVEVQVLESPNAWENSDFCYLDFDPLGYAYECTYGISTPTLSVSTFSDSTGTYAEVSMEAEDLDTYETLMTRSRILLADASSDEIVDKDFSLAALSSLEFGDYKVIALRHNNFDPFFDDLSASATLQDVFDAYYLGKCFYFSDLHAFSIAPPEPPEPTCSEYDEAFHLEIVSGVTGVDTGIPFGLTFSIEADFPTPDWSEEIYFYYDMDPDFDPYAQEGKVLGVLGDESFSIDGQTDCTSTATLFTIKAALIGFDETGIYAYPPLEDCAPIASTQINVVPDIAIPCDGFCTEVLTFDAEYCTDNELYISMPYYDVLPEGAEGVFFYYDTNPDFNPYIGQGTPLLNGGAGPYNIPNNTCDLQNYTIKAALIGINEVGVVYSNPPTDVVGCQPTYATSILVYPELDASVTSVDEENCSVTICPNCEDFYLNGEQGCITVYPEDGFSQSFNFTISPTADIPSEDCTVSKTVEAPGCCPDGLAAGYMEGTGTIYVCGDDHYYQNLVDASSPDTDFFSGFILHDGSTTEIGDIINIIEYEAGGLIQNDADYPLNTILMLTNFTAPQDETGLPILDAFCTKIGDTRKIVFLTPLTVEQIGEECDESTGIQSYTLELSGGYAAYENGTYYAYVGSESEPQTVEYGELLSIETDVDLGILDLTLIDDYCFHELSIETAACYISSIQEQDPVDLQLECYPNPLLSGQQLNVKWVNDAPSGKYLSLVDVSGKLIYEQTLGAHTAQTVLNLNVPAGIYLLQLVDDKGVSRNKRLLIY